MSHLSDSKRAGRNFTTAWRLAMRDHPPSSRAQLASADGKLFGEDGKPEEPEEPLADAFARFCEDAWHGRHSKLRRFSSEMLIGDGDDTSSARIVRTAA